MHNTHRQHELKRQQQAQQHTQLEKEKIQNAKNEINNLQVILEAIPSEKIEAREIIASRIADFEKLLPKFPGRIWWHWLLEYCPKCDRNLSQSPFAENLGEDCLMFEEIAKYKDEGLMCSCGTKLTLKYRHAIADLNEQEKKLAFEYADKANQ